MTIRRDHKEAEQLEDDMDYADFLPKEHRPRKERIVASISSVL